MLSRKRLNEDHRDQDSGIECDLESVIEHFLRIKNVVREKFSNSEFPKFSFILFKKFQK
jgi:hypothetical protein